MKGTLADEVIGTSEASDMSSVDKVDIRSEVRTSSSAVIADVRQVLIDRATDILSTLDIETGTVEATEFALDELISAVKKKL